MRFTIILVRLFPLGAVVVAAAALTWPAGLARLAPAIVPLLGVVMFGMGLTLSAREFAEVARQPINPLKNPTTMAATLPTTTCRSVLTIYILML